MAEKQEHKRLLIDDRVANYQANFKENGNAKLKKLNKEDIKLLMKLMTETDMAIFEAAPEYGLTSIGIGIGTIKIKYRDPIKFRNVHTKEEGMTYYTPLFYFKPKNELKSRVKYKLNEVKQREKELEELGEEE